MELSLLVEIGPVTVTTDPDEFEDQLAYLYVQVSTMNRTSQY